MVPQRVTDGAKAGRERRQGGKSLARTRGLSQTTAWSHSLRVPGLPCPQLWSPGPLAPRWPTTNGGELAWTEGWVSPALCR